MEFFSYPELKALAVCPFSELGQLIFLLFPTLDSTCARLLMYCSIQRRSPCLTTFFFQNEKCRDYLQKMLSY